jgi:hypothetical protein
MDVKHALILSALAALTLAGCKAGTPETAAESATTVPKDLSGSAARGTSDDIRPMTPSGGIPNAPVAGGDNLGGTSGGGVGQAMKDRARGVAGTAGASSIDQATGGE